MRSVNYIDFTTVHSWAQLEAETLLYNKLLHLIIIIIHLIVARFIFSDKM